MSNGNIITPLMPNENIEVNRETPGDIYTPSDSPDNQKEEAQKLDTKICCKKWNCYEIIFLIIYFIIFSLIITSIINQIAYDIFPYITLIYGTFSFISFAGFCDMKSKQEYDSSILLGFFFLYEGIMWSIDFYFYFSLEYYKSIKIKNEFIANSFIYLKVAEFFFWVLNIFLFMCSTHSRTGKFCLFKL